MRRAFIILTLLCAGCEPEPLTLPATGEPLPELLSAMGVGGPDDSHPDLIDYAPRYPLWTNGSEKTRWIVVPEGETVTGDETALAIPTNTFLFKTFSYDGVPVETRVMRRTDEGWEFGVYQWEGEDARLLEAFVSTEVTVETSDGSITHTIPSIRDCRTCHASNADDQVIGFSPLQLGDSLGELADEGVLAAGIGAPAGVEGSTPEETAVLQYVTGNCAHCHNGLGGENRSIDLRPDVFVDTVVGMETQTSGSPRGVRVVPGNPDESVLFGAVSRENDFVMPPLGVDVRDEEGIRIFRDWIESLP